jgi:transcriptional regulator with XRE-family HTH domain
METKIHPHVIKGLMGKRGLNQQALADRSGVSLSTIKRICGGKEMAKGLRHHTVSQLAKHLRVSEDELTAPDTQSSQQKSSQEQENEHLNSSVRLKASISRQNDLSFQAVEAIYGISRKAQITMAPLFAALIAEASLKWRQERLDALGAVAERLEVIRGDNPLLNAAFSHAWEAEKIELRSIEAKDVLGHQALRELNELFEVAGTDFGLLMNHDVPNRLPHELVSPFLAFLQDFASSFTGSDIKVELGDENDDPQIPNGVAEYRVGESLFAAIIGESVWAKLAIEFGHVRLADIASDLKDPAKREDLVNFFRDRTPHEQRVAWAQEQLEFLNEWRAAAGEEPLIPTEELINEAVSRLEEGELS